MIQDRIKELRRVPASQLIPHPLNYRKHPARQKQLLSQLFGEIGYADALLAYETPQGLQLIDGHLRAETTPDQEVPVLVLDVTEQEANKLLLTLDPLASLAETDAGLLGELLKSTETTGEIDAWLQERAEEVGLTPEPLVEPAEVPPDRYAEVCKKWFVQPGEIWQLGRHRLLCGDSLLGANYERLLAGDAPALVIADPPYGVSIVNPDTGTVGNAAPGRGIYAPIIGDGSTDTAHRSSAACMSIYPAAVHVWWGANYYASALPDSMCWLVWDKHNGSDFADCELAWVNQRKAARLFTHQWSGMIRASERDKRWHPTQKPAALASWVYSLFLKEPSVILDPFGGAGWSLLAAETDGHSARVIEMSPEYCAVICERWHQQTGQTPVLLNTANSIKRGAE